MTNRILNCPVGWIPSVKPAMIAQPGRSSLAPAYKIHFTVILHHLCSSER